MSSNFGLFSFSWDLNSLGRKVHSGTPPYTNPFKYSNLISKGGGKSNATTWFEIINMSLKVRLDK